MTVPGIEERDKMTLLITDPELEERLLAERRAWGGDRYDEVWDGVYVMSPIANIQHQDLVMGIAYAFHSVVGLPGLGTVLPGTNVSDRAVDWEKNYRVPDVAVYLKGNPAQHRETHWLGGPDLAVEVVSRGDRTREKLGFYAAVGTRELLVVNRRPWSLELYRLDEGSLGLIGASTLDNPGQLASAVVPLGFGLAPGESRPSIVIAHRDGAQRWTV